MSTTEQQQLPSREELKERAVEGHPITTEEVSKIAKTETELTDGRGPIAGGVAATAQSLKAKQEHFIEVASEVSHKPVDEITKKDAAAVESAEARLLGHRPPKGSTAATIQSIADKNERLMSETKKADDA
ncbi:seed maturation protein-domain-containing protein [Pseudoneurospora amorphoporcata]|uniref:Seed maturation protein-domain-containing protein n=1 Tax=Pseudoneurospora amorphoporcata TaxID=241081 RepID=A0AAN6SFK4_9PEZI|nr:seed maturation protein-domain-containing protein [Pseudoneurospora amorphoporcata]